MTVAYITVTQEDIDLGVPGDPGACPLARAARRRFGGTLCAAGERLKRDHPKHAEPPLGFFTAKAVQFQDDFDRGLKVKPGRFAVRLRDG